MSAIEVSLPCGRRFLIDQDDWSWISTWNIPWHALPNRHTAYVVAQPRAQGRVLPQIRLHTLVMDPPRGLVVDHINGDGLDNRRENLRLAGASLNARNRHTRKPRALMLGVERVKGASTYAARLRVHGRRVHVGCFRTEREAAAAYDAAVRLVAEPCSLRNFPDEASDAHMSRVRARLVALGIDPDAARGAR